MCHTIRVPLVREIEMECFTSKTNHIAARSKVTTAADFVIKVGHNLSGKCPTHENKRKSILNKLIINALYVVASKDMKIFNGSFFYKGSCKENESRMNHLKLH